MQKSSTKRITTLHHRTFRRTSSPFFRQRNINSSKKNSSFSLLSSRPFSGVFGNSVMSTFIKTSVVFYAIPLSAIASPYLMTLPLDVIYGCVLPYHAYVGMAHIFTDYAPRYLPLAYAIGIVMFLGLQNLNFQGEGISPMVRRVFTRKELPTTKEYIQQTNWLNKAQ